MAFGGVEAVEKNVEVAMLLDVYGEVLTEKQRDIIDLYYNEDMSLGEIASNLGITRQGVRDFLLRGEATMYDLEEKLHFLRRRAESEASIRSMQENCDKIDRYNEQFVYSPQLRSALREIKEQIDELSRSNAL